MSKTFAVLFFILIMISTSFAQMKKDNTYSHAIGLTASSISGSGLSYRYSLNELFALKFAGLVFYNESNSSSSTPDPFTSYVYSDNYFVYNIGAELQWSFFKTDDTRLYTLLGANYWYDNDKYDYSDTYNDDYNVLETTKNIGIGLGLEFRFWERVLFNLDGGYQFRYYMRNYDYPGTARDTENWERGLHFGGGLGLSYAF